MRIRMLLVLAALLLEQPAQAGLDSAKVESLAHSQRWLRLLHYKSHWFRGLRSTVDGEGFFFSPKGVSDPKAELLATVDALLHRQGEKISKLKQPPACAFPARFRFLNEELQLGLQMPGCERWQEFMARFHEPQSLTLVFSTAFPNNPASMFGHTFLRVNGKTKPGQEKVDLLDYGLGYAAVVGENDNPFVFAWSGLTGGYQGSFTATPYYSKVQEYNDSESRDLWEYDLDVNEDQTWWLLANVWELEVNSFFDYFFLDENCAYEMLTLLEVARPDWDISHYLYHMIPSESVKRVVGVPGAVKSVKFRPSLFKRLLALGERLSPEERAGFFSLVKGEAPVEAASAASLEAAAAYFHYLRQRKDGRLSELETALMQKILLERSKKGEVKLPEPVFDESSRPEWGHYPSRFSLAEGRMKVSSAGSYAWYQELGFKFAYHDLLNHDVGYMPYSEISFPNLYLRYSADESRFWVNRVEVFSLYSLSPWSWMKNSLSWEARSAYEVPQDLCSFCHVWHGEGAVGISQPVAKDEIRFYELAGAYAELGQPLARRWRVGSKFFVGALANVTNRWKQHLEATLSSDPIKAGGEPYFASILWGQSYFFSQTWEARAYGRASLRFRDAARGRNEAQMQILANF